MIKFEHVTFQYGVEDEMVDTSKVQDITFTIEKGNCAVLCGRSGAGKSTILRLASGLAPGFYEGTMKGRITLNGYELAKFTPEQKARMLGVVFQDPRSQFFMGIVQDEIAFSAENIGIPSEEAKRYIDEAAELLGISKLLMQNVSELSSGQKQRVAIAAAIVLKPPVLILDEPVSNLDQKGIVDLLNVLNEIKKRGTTIIISEHRLYEFLPIVDQYIHIDGGRIKHFWTKEEFEKIDHVELSEYGFRDPRLERQNARNDTMYSMAIQEISVEKLMYHYRRSKKGVYEANLRFGQGDVVALLGENGAGKTTLCKVLCGLLKPQSGKVLWCGKTTSCAKRRQMSYLVMQDADYQLYSDSVGNELVMGRKVTKQLKERAYEALELFRLKKLIDKHPASLSGGEKQRVTMAASYCSDVDIYVLDEPTSGMDGEGLKSIVKWVKILSDLGKMVIIITHDELLCKMACNKKLWMENGYIRVIE